MSLQKETKDLMKWLTILNKKFEKNNPPKSMQDREFFMKMKEETKPLFTLLSRWEKNALAFIKQYHTKKVFPHQIIATRENIEVLTMHSYYIDIRKRLYMERLHSCRLVLQHLLQEIQEEKRDD